MQPDFNIGSSLSVDELALGGFGWDGLGQGGGLEGRKETRWWLPRRTTQQILRQTGRTLTTLEGGTDRARNTTLFRIGPTDKGWHLVKNSLNLSTICFCAHDVFNCPQQLCHGRGFMFVSVFVGTWKNHIIMQRAIKAILLKSCCLNGKWNFDHLHWKSCLTLLSPSWQDQIFF